MPLKQRAMERVSDEQSSHAACKRRRHYTHWRACLRCPKQRALARLSDEQSCHATCFVAALHTLASVLALPKAVLYRMIE